MVGQEVGVVEDVGSPQQKHSGRAKCCSEQLPWMHLYTWGAASASAACHGVVRTWAGWMGEDGSLMLAAPSSSCLVAAADTGFVARTQLEKIDTVEESVENRWKCKTLGDLGFLADLQAVIEVYRSLILR
jgi:hypothetical protein